MAAVLEAEAMRLGAEAPVVVVGSGPAGVRVAQELARRAPALPVVLYGAEESEPYNRVRLSSFLAGELAWDGLTRDLRLPERARIERRYGCAVVAIARRSRTVFDARNRAQAYCRLVI
ncbi:MAG: FAD-dependent oxidoreductase, partial [Pseudomonadota bacterium]